MGIFRLTKRTIGRPPGNKFPDGLDTLVVGVDTIANAATNASGGAQTIEGSNAIHVFTATGSTSFTPQYDLTLDFLVIGGGGGGGGHGGGGGGAGGYRTSAPGETTGGGGSAEPSVTVTGGTTVTVTIGGGGAGGSNADGAQGTPSKITGPGLSREIHSEGGGYGNGHNTYVGPGGPGGSGGGASFGAPGTVYAGGTANTSVVQGYNGGGGGSSGYKSGGGGGAGEVGNTDGEMYGGDGLTSNITGSPVTRAGGGGGNSQTGANGPGGDGGGGDGNNSSGSTAPAGAVNTGSGGGSQHHLSGGGGAGGSGFVALRYAYNVVTSSTQKFYSIGGANSGVVVS